MHGSVRVLTPDAATTAALDRLLWLDPPLSFLPHCRMDSPIAAETPIWIDDALEHSGPAAVLRQPARRSRRRSSAASSASPRSSAPTTRRRRRPRALSLLSRARLRVARSTTGRRVIDRCAGAASQAVIDADRARTP